MASYLAATAPTAHDHRTEVELEHRNPDRSGKLYFGSGRRHITDFRARSCRDSEVWRLCIGRPKSPVLKHARSSSTLGPTQVTRIKACFPGFGAPHRRIRRYRHRP